MRIKFLQIKRALSVALFVLLMVVGLTKTMAQTPYRQYANDGVLLNFHEIDNVDFRLFLLYNLSQDDRFALIEDDTPGLFSIISDDEENNADFYDTFEAFYQNVYTDFSLLSKTDIQELFPSLKSNIPPTYLVSIMMDVSLRNNRNDNYLCVNSLPFYTTETMQFEAANTSQTADQLEAPGVFDDGCIGSSYNPSWFHMEIADPGQFIIHIEGHDPDNIYQGRDIDFCVWGPFTNPTTPCVAQLTADKIMDCSYSANYTENLFLGYPEAEHNHTTSHGTVNYHMPESGEYYILMITNYSRQPCVITFSQIGGTGSSGCNGSKSITANANSIEGGTVAGSGEYECGSSCTLTATANDGYVFMDWTDENGVLVSTDTEFTFTVYTNKNFTANFVEESTACYLTFNLNDSNGNGWSGNYLVLNFEDGSFQILTVPYDMSVSSYALPILDGSHVSLGWISGLYTEQCSFTVNYSNGNTICYASNLNNDYGFEFDVDCAEMPMTTFVITASANPIEGGIVSGGGGYDCGSTCTLTATANEGYTFVCWIENGQQVSAEAEYSFFAMCNRNLLAVFAPFSITAESNPAEGGTVSGTGEYDYGSTCTLTAIANEGYTFMYWTENGQQVSSNASYSFTVTQEHELVAHFALPFSITAEADPEAGGSITGSGEYDYYSTCTLTAVANEGYTFMYWAENGQQVSSNASYSFTVTQEHELVAHFALPFSITAEADPEAGGSITGSGEYDYYSTCTLTAVANEGYTFMYWTENGQQVSSNASYSFTVTQEHELVAHFALPFNITAEADPEAGGSITGSGEYDYYSTCLLTATANPGYYFVKWTENGQQVSSNPRYSFRVTHNRNLVAVFSPYCHVQVSTNPSTGGMISFIQSVSYDFDNGLQGWTTIDADGDGYTWVSSMNPGNYHNAGVDLTGTGHNASAHYVISGSWANGTGQVLYPDNYLVSPQVTLAAGSTFSFWACAQDASYAADHFGVVISDNGTSDWTMVNEWTMTAKGNGAMSYGRDGNNRAQGNWYNYTVDLSAYAGQKYIAIRHFNCSDQFILNVDDISIDVYSSVTEAIQYYYPGQTCYLTALPNDGYYFNNWIENGEVVSTEPFYSFTVTDDRNLVANFGLYPHWSPEIYQNSMFMIGVVEIDGVEQASPTLELGAFCNAECRGAELPVYDEGRWLYYITIGGNSGDSITFRLYDHILQQELVLLCPVVVPFEVYGLIGIDDPYEVLFASASTLTVFADVNPENAGIVTGTGEYAQGTDVILTATANEGYIFNNWTLDGEIVSTEPSYTFTVTESVNLTANFHVVRTQQLIAGWNWWSSSLEITLNDLKTALVEALPGTTITIKSQTNNTTYNPNNHRWVGSVTWDLSKMYMIKVDAACEVTLHGYPIDPAQHPASIINGVNWISFPLSQSMLVNDALVGFPAVEHDIIKSQTNNTIFIRDLWRGALTTFELGKGYMFISNSQDSRILTFPTNTK